MHHCGHSSEGSCRVLLIIVHFWCNNLPGACIIVVIVLRVVVEYLLIIVHFWCNNLPGTCIIVVINLRVVVEYLLIIVPFWCNNLPGTCIIVVIVLRVVVEYLLIFVCLLVQQSARHMHHCGHSSEGSCRVLTDNCTLLVQ